MNPPLLDMYDYAVISGTLYIAATVVILVLGAAWMAIRKHT